MNLFIKFFRPDNLQRYSEYLTCLHENLALFDHVYIFCSDASPYNFRYNNAKVMFLEKQGNLTFLDFFNWANKHSDHLKETCVLANGDILFDDSINLLKDLDDKTFIALSRWEMDGKMFESASSQDVWAFKAPVRTRKDMDFGLGQPGNDNRLARIMYELGYEVKNPAKDIKTTHFHLSDYRPNLEWDKVPGPYLSLPPSTLAGKTNYILTDNLWS